MTQGYSPRRNLYEEGGFYLWCLFFVALFYVVYRYPFKINEDIPSSGYTVTPLFLKAGKYVLIVLLLGWAVLRRFFAANPWNQQPGAYPLLSILYGFLTLTAVAITVVTEESRLGQIAAFLLIPFVVYLFSLPEIDPRHLYGLFRWAAVFALLFNILTVVLYLVVGRLPALAYRGTVAIRFGSYMDDPNGFGILLSCLIPFSWMAFRGIGRYLLVFGLLASLPITQSLSGILGTVFAILVLLLVRTLNDPSPVKLGILCIVVIFAGVFFLNASEIMNSPFTQDLVKFKQGSLNVHYGDFEKLFDLKPAAWLGIDPTGEVSETSYAETLQNYGIVFLLVILGLRIFACVRYCAAALRPHEPRECVAIWSGFFCYLTCNLFAGFTLPVERSFPTNMLLMMMMTLAGMDRFTKSHRLQSGFGTHLNMALSRA